MEYDIKRFSALLEQGIYIKKYFVDKDIEYSDDYKQGFKDCERMVYEMSNQILELMKLGVSDFTVPNDNIPQIIDMGKINKDNIISHGKYLEVYWLQIKPWLSLRTYIEYM